MYVLEFLYLQSVLGNFKVKIFCDNSKIFDSQFATFQSYSFCISSSKFLNKNVHTYLQNKLTSVKHSKKIKSRTKYARVRNIGCKSVYFPAFAAIGSARHMLRHRWGLGERSELAIDESRALQ